MKKIPLLLSTLTLATGVSGLVNATLASPTLATDTVVTSTEVTDLYFEDLYTMSEYFRIEELDFINQRLTYNVGHAMSTEWTLPQKILIVARDYEGGITEKEADEASKTLGVGDDAWYQTLVTSKKVGATNYMLANGIADNLSDIIYFAIQYGHKTNQGLEDVYWVRGKVDYRKCIHSDFFDAKTMTCTVRVNNNTQTAELAGIAADGYITFPEDEKVLTWEEEWKEAVKEHIADLNTLLMHIKAQLPITGVTLDQAGTSIKNLQKSIAEMTDTQPLDKGLTQLQTLLQQTQAVYDWMIGAEQQKNMDSLQAQLDAALAEIERLKQESTTGADEIAQAQRELAEMTQKWREAQEKLVIVEADNQQKQADLVAAQAELEKLYKEIQVLQEHLGALEAKLSESTATNTAIRTEIAQLREQIAEILHQKEEIMQKAQILTNENDELLKQYTELQKRNAELQQKIQNYSQLQQENQDLWAENNKLSARIRELEAELAQKSNCTVVGKVRVGDKPLDEAVESVTEPDIISTNVEVRAEESAIEVPNLGEVETKTNFWWVVAAIVGALGVLGICCKKRLDREH